VRTRCSDDMAWLPFVTAEYVHATGDATILSEKVPFLSGAPLGPDEHDRYEKFELGASASSLFEHCRRALERASTSGAHGLPLMGDGDWNDGMNRVGAKGSGESVWLGWFLIATMSRFASLCDLTRDADQAIRWRSRGGALRSAIMNSAWDGAWYVRAFHDDGSIVGSSSRRECRIDSIAQSWSVLCGAVDEGRAKVALRSAVEQLVLEPERLVLLLTPPFDSTRHDPGYIRAYPPGVRENGGQYTHAAAWLGLAHATLGDGQGAERIFRLLNPIRRTLTRQDVTRYRIEPYVVAGDVYSAPPHVGRGGWSWYTGSAAWLYRLGVEAILGLVLERGLLRIDPCIPPAWHGFESWLRIGEETVHVVVENPDGSGAGVASLTIDGVRSEPQSIRLGPRDSARGGPREVRVRLGMPRPAARTLAGKPNARRSAQS